MLQLSTAGGLGAALPNAASGTTPPGRGGRDFDARQVQHAANGRGEDAVRQGARIRRRRRADVQRRARRRLDRRRAPMAAGQAARALGWRIPGAHLRANCPQRLHTWPPEQTFCIQWTDGWQSEDMLKVNIWTYILTGSRSVMVYPEWKPRRPPVGCRRRTPAVDPVCACPSPCRAL